MLTIEESQQSDLDSSSKKSERSAVHRRLERCRKKGGDFSVAYALHYPNGEGGAPTLPVEVAGEAGILVKAHVDPSLFVVEPVSDVAGLDVYDPVSNMWLNVERSSKSPASEWVVFGGRCLEASTGVKACLHRVTSSDYHDGGAEKPGGIKSPRRFCFIYEQKLEDFYGA